MLFFSYFFQQQEQQQTNAAEYYHIVSRLYSMSASGTCFTHSLQCDHKTQNHAVTQPFYSPDDVSFLSILLPTQLKSAQISSTQLNSTQLINADSTVPPAKQYLYLSLEHKELNNQNRDIYIYF